jgi:hypothetical protein
MTSPLKSDIDSEEDSISFDGVSSQNEDKPRTFIFNRSEPLFSIQEASDFDSNQEEEEQPFF